MASIPCYVLTLSYLLAVRHFTMEHSTIEHTRLSHNFYSTYFEYDINILPPVSDSFSRDNSSFQNITLHMEIERISMGDLLTGMDDFYSTLKMNQSFIRNSTMAIHTPTVGVENLYPALIECFGIVGLGYLAGR